MRKRRVVFLVPKRAVKPVAGIPRIKAPAEFVGFRDERGRLFQADLKALRKGRLVPIARIREPNQSRKRPR